MKDLIELLKTKPVIFIVGTLCVTFLIKQTKDAVIEVKGAKKLAPSKK